MTRIGPHLGTPEFDLLAFIQTQDQTFIDQVSREAVYEEYFLMFKVKVYYHTDLEECTVNSITVSPTAMLSLLRFIWEYTVSHTIRPLPSWKESMARDYTPISPITQARNLALALSSTFLERDGNNIVYQKLKGITNTRYMGAVCALTLQLIRDNNPTLAGQFETLVLDLMMEQTLDGMDMATLENPLARNP